MPDPSVISDITITDGGETLNIAEMLKAINKRMPAWEELSEDERFVLEEFYWEKEDSQTDAVYAICEHFSIERSSAYNKKNRALDKLTLLLYGK